VLDISNLLAAPQVAAILGDFGAEVVKLEAPSGDPLRSMGTQHDGHSLMWAFVNRNKLGITLDLSSAEGQRVFRRLLPRFDVLVENLPAGLQQRWHCSYEELQVVNPGLVVVSVTCYGQDGPYRDRPGAGSLAEAFAGLTALTGEAGGPPMLTSLPLGDMLTGIVGALGATTACLHRARGGPGQHVDVSMYEPVLQLLASTMAAYTPGGPAPARNGSRVPGGAPRNVYRTADDRWIVVSGTTDAQVARLLGLLGRDTAEARTRFGTSEARLRSADELDALVASWASTLARDDLLAVLLEARIPAAPVNDLAAVLADPHVRARGDVVLVEDMELGPLRFCAPAPRLDRTPGRIAWTGPQKGADNEAFYRGWLGMAGDELARLRAERVVS
jgi:crotonobetainyl-CoA:carnitine CoA-transferase CaiB-like acyl-CoA transferase